MPRLDSTTRTTVTVATMADNIVTEYRRATRPQHAAGHLWYRRASGIARDIGPDRDTGAGLLAALSPRTRWSENVRLARALRDGRPCDTLGRNVRNARAILAGANPLDILRGPKTRAFYVAIRSAGRSGIAVCDAWAVRGATRGEYDAVADCRYADVAEAYAVAADTLGEPVHVVQATVWTVVRGGHE